MLMPMTTTTKDVLHPLKRYSTLFRTCSRKYLMTRLGFESGSERTRVIVSRRRQTLPLPSSFG